MQHMSCIQSQLWSSHLYETPLLRNHLTVETLSPSTLHLQRLDGAATSCWRCCRYHGKRRYCHRAVCSIYRTQFRKTTHKLNLHIFLFRQKKIKTKSQIGQKISLNKYLNLEVPQIRSFKSFQIYRCNAEIAGNAFAARCTVLWREYARGDCRIRDISTD